MYSIGKFAKKLGVTTQTLRNWHNSKELIPIKITNGGTRYYSEEQYKKYIYQDSITKEKKIYVYCRVSNKGQKDDLKNQIKFVKDFCNAKGWITEELTDIGSGLNYKRKNWNRLLDEVSDNKVEKIIISHKDRFIRFGFEWFENFCNKHNTEIIVVNNEFLSPDGELIKDLISIIHVFSCRIYGLRKYKKAIKQDENL